MTMSPAKGTVPASPPSGRLPAKGTVPASPHPGRLPAEGTAQQLRRLAAYRPKTRPSNSAVWPPTGRRHGPATPPSGRLPAKGTVPATPPSGRLPAKGTVPASPPFGRLPAEDTAQQLRRWPPTGRRHGPATPPLATFRPRHSPSSSAHLPAEERVPSRMVNVNREVTVYLKSCCIRMGMRRYGTPP